MSVTDEHGTSGLIPAHAGKTSPYVASGGGEGAHPRSRGENPADIYSVHPLTGSSPLTRGKRRCVLDALKKARLIPAHAGKTPPPESITTASAAHPRSRGENPTDATTNLAAGGSSPLTRGKHFLTCAFTAQIDQILETLELAASSGSYSIWVACATDAPQDQVQSIGLVLPSSRGAS